MAIKWRPQDEAELKSLIRRANAKRRRLISRNEAYELALPDTFRIGFFRDYSETRQDYNRVKNYLQRFIASKPKDLEIQQTGAGLTTPWEKKEIKLLERVVNKRKRFIRERAGLADAGEAVDWYPYSEEEINLRSQYYSFENKSRADIEAKTLDYLVKTQRNYESNKGGAQKRAYMKGLNTVLGDAGFDLIHRINKIPDKEFYFMQMTNEIFMPAWLYNTPISTQAKRETVEDELRKLGY